MNPDVAASPFSTDAEALEALDRGVAWSDRSNRSRLQVSGPDRARFLHNLTTNEVKRLPEGRGCEAFVTSPQGKTIGYVTLHAGPEHILVRADAGGLALALPHFQKYGVFDDVAIDDRSQQTFEHHLVGPRAPELLRSLGVDVPPEGDLTHHAATLAGKPVLVVRESPTGDPGLTLVGEADDADPVKSTLFEAGKPLGLARLSPTQFDALRVEAGTPEFGKDVTETNLPQEIDRDRRAINFVKGCYLGQETVARLDALGHVNKILRALDFEADEPPAPGLALESGGKAVGTITSTALSLRSGRAIGLAIVRVSHAAPGTELVYSGSLVARVRSLGAG
ncbi:MAG TPA: glycine cleavage T C-terminal barrel domain-containing protein [Isosphaeraceae bacterium]|nr:glycine cleavage T C-terminal barrel domain-containing protein [Isosphaeraceae bacterium]